MRLRTRFVKARNTFTLNNMKQVIDDLPRHHAFSYGSRNSLSQAYFIDAYRTLTDPYLYFVFSNTGSVPSEMIAVFTDKKYNHVSLAFDADLETLISYNGGENVLPPGLNQEKLEFLNKKPDASVAIYKMKLHRAQKSQIIDRVREINEEGSSYNILGLLVPVPRLYKPNIMYCSQFAYSMLEEVGQTYFNKGTLGIKPTDFIEQDKKGRLEFVKEIHFNV